MSTAAAAAKEERVAPGITIRSVSVEAPWDWIHAGWRDMWLHPHISLGFGVVFTVLALLFFIGLTFIDMQSVILALAGGFFIISPAFAVGLYDLSRRIEAGAPVSLRAVVMSAAHAPGQLGFLGAILAFLYYIWIQIALLLFMLFFGGATGFPPASEFVETLLYTRHGLGLLIVGTIIGAVLAATAFSIAVVSVPLLTVRPLDAISAINISFQAVARNYKPMALWAALIGFVIAIGFLTSFIGLVFAFPLIGHASWHAFREVIKLDDLDQAQ